MFRALVLHRPLAVLWAGKQPTHQPHSFPFTPVTPWKHHAHRIWSSLTEGSTLQQLLERIWTSTPVGMLQTSRLLPWCFPDYAAATLQGNPHHSAHSFLVRTPNWKTYFFPHWWPKRASKQLTVLASLVVSHQTSGGCTNWLCFQSLEKKPK